MPPSALPERDGPDSLKRGKAYAVLLVAVAVLVAGTATGILFFRAARAPLDLIHRYVQALNEEDAEEALGLLHPHSRLREGFDPAVNREKLAASGEAPLRIRSARADYLTGSRASIDVELEGANRSRNLLEFDLRREDGGWRIYDYERI